MFQNLLFCTDFTDGIHRLTRFVPSLVTTGVKRIVFMHCVPLDGGEIPRVNQEKLDQARAQLQPALENIPAGVDVHIEVVSGKPSEMILRTAKTYQSELVVLGMPIAGVLKEKLFGSTTMNLCPRTTTPLMILRPQLVSTYTSEELDLRCRHLFRYLLIPYDGSETAKYLIGQIKALAVNRDRHSLERCHLCWVAEDVTRRGLPKDFYVEPARQAIALVATDLKAIGLEVTAEVRQGDPVVEILELAQMVDVSVIAISSGSLGKLQELSIPSFTRELIRRSWHPILYFPPKR